MSEETKLQFSPDVLTIQQYIHTLFGKVNRAFVRSQMVRRSTFPVLSINDFVDILSSWNLQSSILKIEADKLHMIDIPVLMLYQNKQRETQLILVYKIEKLTVYYFSPNYGDTVTHIENFKKYYKGIVIAALSSENTLAEITCPNDQESLNVETYMRNNIRIVKSLLSDAQCEALINYIEQKKAFMRSKVDVNEYTLNQESLARTSYTAFLSKSQDHEFYYIYEKVSTLLNVPIDYIENLQCVRYFEGQEFKPHYDSGKMNHRAQTLLIYLNDNFKGGETFFPELNFRVEPRKGNALYFKNRDVQANTISQSLHAGLPVTDGIKYTCNVWIGDRPFGTKQESATNNQA